MAHAESGLGTGVFPKSPFPPQLQHLDPVNSAQHPPTLRNCASGSALAAAPRGLSCGAPLPSSKCAQGSVGPAHL